MANKIILKKSSVANKVPLATDLEIGELAVNLADAKLYSKNASGTVISVGGGSGSGDVVGPSSATDNALVRFDGTTGKLIQNGLITSDDAGNVANINSLGFDTTPTTVPTTEGSLYWDSADGIQTLSLVMANGNAVQQIGQEQYYRIKASAAITNGQVVMFTGTVGASGALTGAPATGLTAATASYIMGIATQDIALNGWGYITAFGLVRQIDTSAFAAGDILYYNPSVTGGLTTTIPSAPNAKIQVCAVVNSSATVGSLFVRPSFGGILGQYEGDVNIASPLNGQLLIRDQTSGKWVNANLTAGTGISITNAAGSVTIANSGVTSLTGTTNEIDVSASTGAVTLSLPATINADTTGNAATATSAGKWTTARTLSFTGDATGSGSVDGSANVATALTLANTAVTAGSYTNTSLTVDAKGRITAASSGTAPVTSVGATAPIASSGGATPTISISQASSTTNGYLSSTDWNTFNNKGSGTVTSVTGTSPVASSGGTTPAISLASAYGDTQNPYGSKTANYVLAAPNGTAGAPTFRAIVAADIPTLNQNTTGTAAGLSSTLAIASGGTGATSATAALTALGAQAAATAINTSNIGSQSVNYATSAGNADTLDGQHGSYYQPASTAITTSNIGSQSVNYATSAGSATSATTAGSCSGNSATVTGIRQFGTIAVQAVAGSSQSCTTAQFVSWYSANYGFLSYAYTVAKCSWDYAGNNDISDTSIGSCEMAGSVIETFSDGTYYTIRITRPTTGAGGSQQLVYNNQGSGYSPGWWNVLNTSNYTSYSPSLTGTGASGTWGINVTGSAGSVSGNSNGLAITGFGSGNQTYYQTSGTFAGYTGWAGHFVSNHGDGATYYNQTIITPFWSAPKYSRQQGNTTTVGPYTFGTTENFTTDSWTATAAQTTFSTSATYASSRIQVFANGIKMVNGSDVTVTSGNQIVFASGLASGTNVQAVYTAI